MGIGAVGGDGGSWLRQQCLIMSQANSSPVGFWLSMPLKQFMQWIGDHNRIAQRIWAKTR